MWMNHLITQELRANGDHLEHCTLLCLLQEDWVLFQRFHQQIQIPLLLGTGSHQWSTICLDYLLWQLQHPVVVLLIGLHGVTKHHPKKDKTCVHVLLVKVRPLNYPANLDIDQFSCLEPAVNTELWIVFVTSKTFLLMYRISSYKTCGYYYFT